MKIITAKTLLTVACLLLFGASALHGETLDSLKKTYSGITTVQAHFRQQIFVSALKRQREMEGDFFYKRGRDFVWRYTVPKKRYSCTTGRPSGRQRPTSPTSRRTRLTGRSWRAASSTSWTTWRASIRSSTLKGRSGKTTWRCWSLLPKKKAC